MNVTEKKIDSLIKKYKSAKLTYLTSVRDALKDYLKEHNNFVDIPAEYKNDFYFFIDGNEEQITGFVYDEDYKHVYAKIKMGDSTREYAWVFIEDDDYAVDAVVRLIFNREPIFENR